MPRPRSDVAFLLSAKTMRQLLWALAFNSDYVLNACHLLEFFWIRWRVFF